MRISGFLINDYVSAILDKALESLALQKPPPVRLMDSGITDYVQRLVDGQCDVVVAPRFFTPRDEELSFVHLATLPFSVSFKRGHPLAGKGTVRFEDLVGLNLLTYPLENRAEYHSFVRQVLRSEGVRLEVSPVPLNELPVLRDFEADALFGLPYPQLARKSGDVVTRRVDAEVQFDLCAVMHRERKESRHVKAVVDSLRSASKDPGIVAWCSGLA